MALRAPTQRRYALLKRLYAARVGDTAMAMMWRGSQEAETGTALSLTFPARTLLVAAGYTAIEDLDGATADELQRNAGLTASEAEAAIAAAET
jgi:hypothetical protein